MLGCVAAVMDTESPSQLRPAVIQSTSISAIAGVVCVRRPWGADVSVMGIAFCKLLTVEQFSRFGLRLSHFTTHAATINWSQAGCRTPALD